MRNACFSFLRPPILASKTFPKIMFLQNAYVDTIFYDFRMILCESCRFGEPFKILWAPPEDFKNAKVSFLEGPRSSPQKVETDARTLDTFQSKFRSDFEDFSTCFWEPLLLLFAFFLSCSGLYSCSFPYVIYYLIFDLLCDLVTHSVFIS